jgi:RNA polymerase sigma-70 factor (ECF subfamily)
MAEEINLALEEIREDYRIAFQRFHFNEMGYAEIAEELKVPMGTVKTWVHRARREVVTKLQNRGVICAKVAQ